MDIEQLYRDFNIEYVTEGHKHARDGWVNCECVWCETDNPGYHLGYNIENNVFICWKCGKHANVPTMAKLLNVSISEAWNILKQYGGHATFTHKNIVTPTASQLPFTLPLGTGMLDKNHIKYLQGRKFNVEELVETWDLRGTGPIATLKTGTKVLDYRFRIIIPFYWEGKIVSFDSRDITGQAIAKYMACPLERETIPHKRILYGKQEEWGDTGICVEGPTDVWRFGVNSFATSGIKYTPKQVRLMASIFKRIFVCFDGGETQALASAKQLVADLRFRGVEAFLVKIVGDPGAMPQQKANELVNNLLNS